MLKNVNTNIERIIAKIDNDFNPDNSDWIPRVAAWCIDAMNQLNVLQTVCVKRKYKVINKIVRTECPIDNTFFKIYDKNGCEIEKANNNKCSCRCPSTGEIASEASDIYTSGTTSIKINNNNIPPQYVVGETVNSDNEYDVKVRHYNYGSTQQTNNYVIVDSNTIELNFDTDYIFIKQKTIKTEYSDVFKCELPVIPNNGILIEALVYYCIYKMLCRGYKHPVFNLNASQYGTNPYYMWNTMKESAKRSIINNGFNEDSSHLFRSNMFINIFDSRHD